MKRQTVEELLGRRERVVERLHLQLLDDDEEQIGQRGPLGEGEAEQRHGGEERKHVPAQIVLPVDETVAKRPQTALLPSVSQLGHHVLQEQREQLERVVGHRIQHRYVVLLQLTLLRRARGCLRQQFHAHAVARPPQRDRGHPLLGEPVEQHDGVAVAEQEAQLVERGVEADAEAGAVVADHVAGAEIAVESTLHILHQSYNWPVVL